MHVCVSVESLVHLFTVQQAAGDAVFARAADAAGGRGASRGRATLGKGLHVVSTLCVL